MSVIPLTVFFSLLLAGTFVVLFVREQRRRHLTSPERDSLLPLADETPHAVHGRHDGGCACQTGQRTPCAHCLRRRDAQEPAYF